MPKGGARPGAGRPKGRANSKRLEVAAKALEEGITPLEVMLAAMRHHHERATDVRVSKPQRELAWAAACQAAKDAAPYVHPRLQSVEHKGDAENPLVASIAVRFV